MLTCGDSGCWLERLSNSRRSDKRMVSYCSSFCNRGYLKNRCIRTTKTIRTDIAVFGQYSSVNKSQWSSSRFVIPIAHLQTLSDWRLNVFARWNTVGINGNRRYGVLMQSHRIQCWWYFFTPRTANTSRLTCLYFGIGRKLIHISFYDF